MDITAQTVHAPLFVPVSIYCERTRALYCPESSYVVLQAWIKGQCLVGSRQLLLEPLCVDRPCGEGRAGASRCEEGGKSDIISAVHT